MVRSIKSSKKAKRKNKGSKKGEGSSSSDSIPSLPAKVWQPSVDKLEEGKELQCDPSTYNSLHAFHIGWPCLSFDVVCDSLGLVRTEFPHTVYCVVGTQPISQKVTKLACSQTRSVGIFKLSNISGKRRELVPSKSTANDSDMNSNSSDSDEDDEVEDGVSATPLRNIVHEGCVNRIRAMPQNPHLCASWVDTGHVQVWDFSSHLNALTESETEASRGASSVSNQAPLVYCIHLWEPTSGTTWNVDSNPFVGHAASVEDLQPYKTLCLCLLLCGWNIAIWDIHLGKSPAASIKAHNADVNVISWNRLASCMLASGSDDGTFSIRDLRLLKDGDSVVAHLEYHKQPITSIEWSPHEASTMWDLSLERDEEEEAEFKSNTREQVIAPTDLPLQLLFVHQGQKDLKELHWHSQIPGMLISTAADGFNILMPSNIESALPANNA
ncbi:Glutamate-rich WD repeat-containing protein 1 [Camellia lanceoleosa]|uniref:Glutamate-rich WD repeat-containing protein 1 n=1 Tax=Camellia lanceoleosa TaxID=1840588 RepID=A0ACC0I6D0_9ERIC|nr:Glutamate-rich WD repeat-containing protein 1 [Camellia lanceoleosa]